MCIPQNIEQRLTQARREFFRVHHRFPKLIQISESTITEFGHLDITTVTRLCGHSKRPSSLTVADAVSKFMTSGPQTVINRFDCIPVEWIPDLQQEFILVSDVPRLTPN